MINLRLNITLQTNIHIHLQSVQDIISYRDEVVQNSTHEWFGYNFFLLILQRRVCRLCVCVCVCVLCLSTTKPIILIHSSRDGIRRLVDRLNVHKATKKGNIVCIRVIPRDDSHEECASFPHCFTVCICLIFFFCLNVDSPQWSGPPAADPRLIY